MALPCFIGTGGCPYALLTATVGYGQAKKTGFPEFGSPSTPPKSYRHYSMSGGGWSYTSGSSSCSYSTNTTNFGYNATSGDLENASDTDTHVAFTSSAVDRRLQNSLFQNIYTTPPAIADGDPFLIGGDCGSFVPVFHVNSATSVSLDMAAQTSGGASVTAGSLVFTLTDEDTEDDARDRLLNETGSGVGAVTLATDMFTTSTGESVTDWFGDGIFTVMETRNGTPGSGDEWQFGLRACSVVVTLKRVMPGVLYHVVAVIEERDALGQGDGTIGADTSAYGVTWSTIAAVTFDARPDDTTFDCDPFDLPLTAGKQRRIKSLTVTPIDG